MQNLETVGCTEVSKGGKLQATRQKREKADVAASMEQASVDVNARSVCVVRLEGCATELGKQLE